MIGQLPVFCSTIFEKLGVFSPNSPSLLCEIMIFGQLLPVILKLFWFKWKAGALVQWLKLPAWKIGDRGLVPGSALVFQFQRNKMFLSRSLVKIQYCGESPWPKGSVLDLRPHILNPLSGAQCHLIMFKWRVHGSPSPAETICITRGQWFTKQRKTHTVTNVCPWCSNHSGQNE